MNKKLLIGINVVIIGLVIAAAIYNPRWISMLLVGVAPIVVWIYLVWMVRKKKTNIFHDQMEPKLAERRLKRLKAFLLVAGVYYLAPAALSLWPPWTAPELSFEKKQLIPVLQQLLISHPGPAT